MIEWFNSLLTIASGAIIQGDFGALVALFLVAALTEVGVPFPLVIDGALIVASYETGLTSFHVLILISALTLGREAGASVIFWSSRFMGDAFVNWLGRRFPKLKLNLRMIWLNTKLRRHAPLAVAVARLTPGLLFPSSVAAGYSGMRYYLFVLGIVLASIVADGVLVILGAATKYGLSIFGFTPSTWEVVGALTGVFLLGWFVQWIYFRARNKKREQAVLPGPGYIQKGHEPD